MFTLLIFITFIGEVDGLYGNNYLSKDMITKGREMYELILKQREDERHGKCWYNAVRKFEQSCNELTENLQVQLSIGFAKTDQNQIDCGLDEKQNLLRNCFQELKIRTFLTFTEFYTHTHNMCYFLRNQLWHKGTEATIDLLGEMSHHVAAKLTLAEVQEEQLLKHQKIGLDIQKQIFEQGNHLAQSLYESRSNLETLANEFCSVTSENNEIVMELFGKIQSIQNWMLGGYTVFNAIIYYTSCVITTIIFTSSHRTLSSLLPILLFILSLSLICEYTVRVCIEAQYDNNTIETKTKFDFWIWITRNFFFVASVIVCVVRAIKFSDLNQNNNDILKQLMKQNTILLEELNQVNEILLKIMESPKRNGPRILPDSSNRCELMVCLTPIPIMIDSSDTETEINDIKWWH